MNRRMTIDHPHRADFDGLASDSEQRALRPGPDIDSNAMRWVFAATVLFWAVVYAAGRSFF